MRACVRILCKMVDKTKSLHRASANSVRKSRAEAKVLTGTLSRNFSSKLTACFRNTGKIYVRHDGLLAELLFQCPLDAGLLPIEPLCGWLA